MRKIGLALVGMLALVGCKAKESENPVDRILEIGVQAEKDLAENAAKRDATKDVSEAVELGKQEKVIIDSAIARIDAILGGRSGRLPLAVGKSTDSLPVAFAHGTIGVPDFYKNEFRINLQIAGTEKRPIPTGCEFQLQALDAQGKVLSSLDASVVDSLKAGDTVYAGGMFKGSEIKGLKAVSAK
jgi:hypothetical protein